MILNDTTIVALQKKGFSRWTKNGMDRLYVNSTRCGLELNYYKTGSVREAWVNGERISNRRGSALRYSKNYIDIADGSVHSEHPEIRENLAKILADVLAA